MADSSTLGPDDQLGDFRILRTLGEGGMGIVYLAQDEHLNRRVALKVIAPQFAHEAEFQQRFEAEARSAAAIDDPHAVPIYTAGSTAGRPYIAMRYVDGTDLRALLAESGPLDAHAAVAITADIASALDAAHTAGLVHRDVKPANVLLTGVPGQGAAYLTDFGLTKGLQAGGTQLTGTGQWIGTLDYVAPEQMTSGRIDARTDVYALGCVLHEMLSGSVPFPGTDMQKMWNHVNEDLPQLDGGATVLQGVVDRATAKDPGERFPSAGDLARAAVAAADGVSITERERSVATGVAASGLVEVGEEGSPTRTMKSPRSDGPRERATATMNAPAQAAPARRKRERKGSGTSIAAVIGGCIVVAAGLIAGAFVLTGGKENTSRTVVETAPRAPREGGAEASASSAVNEATETVAPTSETSPGEGALTYSQSLYTIEVPASWEQEASDEPSGSYVESVWRDPVDPNTAVLVDAEAPAPSATPLESAESVRAQTSQSSGYRELAFEPVTLDGLPAARWVFDVSGDRRVDYFVNSCGVGLAVLGSTSPATFGEMAPTFHEVASSVLVPCE